MTEYKGYSKEEAKIINECANVIIVYAEKILNTLKKSDAEKSETVPTKYLVNDIIQRANLMRIK